MSAFELCTVIGIKTNEPATTTGSESFWSRCRRNLNPTEEQRRILMIIGIELVIIVVLYQWRATRWLLYPFELIGTVFHEFGHAMTCILTGGKVHSIDVNMDESGLTRFSGGWHCAIAPAGYIGSSVAGCAILFTGFSQKHSRYTAIVICIILLLTLALAGSFSTIIIAAFLITGMGFAIWYQEGRYVQYLILFMGTIASIVSILNILSSTVFHTIPGSDATVFAKQCSVLLPAFVFGLIWALISVALLAGSIGAALAFYK